jgi:hypothetical protein
MRDSKDDLLVEYYASHRASVIINYNEITQSREIGRVFAEYKDKKEHAYSIPKSKVNLYGDNEVYFNISKT